MRILFCSHLLFLCGHAVIRTGEIIVHFMIGHVNLCDEDCHSLLDNILKEFELISEGGEND